MGRRRLAARPPAHSARPGRAAVRPTPPAGGHAVRPFHLARPGRAQLRLLPGCALPPGGNAVGHHACAGRRGTPIDLHSVDRHGPAQPRLLRARVWGRARCDSTGSLWCVLRRSELPRPRPPADGLGHGRPRPPPGLREPSDLMQRPAPHGASVYLRLSTRPIAQPVRSMTPSLQQAILEVGRFVGWLFQPGASSAATDRKVGRRWAGRGRKGSCSGRVLGPPGGR